MYAIKALGKSIVEFLKDECFYLAASISYFSIVALVPLSLLIITLFGYLIGENQQIYKYILSGLISLFPTVTEGITTELRKIITYKGISVLMLGVYAVLSLQLLYSMEHAINVIFKIPKKRHFLLSIFWSILLVTFVIIFLLLSFTVSTTAGLFKKYSISFFGIEIGYKAGILLTYIAPFILVLLTFTAIYIIIPRVKISWRKAFTGALFVTIMWELSKYFFTWYVKNIIHFGTIYGSLTTFILFLLWLFYSSCIFLLGAEYVNNFGRRQ
jgi:membrane protein